jgi:LmbE family N-acetylglucosaminyl deacetylase
VSGRTLLGVWAHPDDEAYLSAGLMLEHLARGDRVVALTATLGERGTDDPDRWPPAKMARRRRGELHLSLAALGVREHHVLGFADGECAGSDGTLAVRRFVDRVRPDVIVTFGPDGMTGHPDHRAVSRWTTQAWLHAAHSCELWYATLTPEFHQRWGSLNDRVGLWGDAAAPPSTPHAELCHELVLPPEHLDRKIDALRAHRSQTAALIGLVGDDTYRAWWSVESFRAATVESLPAMEVAS